MLFRSLEKEEQTKPKVSRRKEIIKIRAEINEEIIVENFPNMGKEIVNQCQEAQRVSYR